MLWFFQGGNKATLQQKVKIMFYQVTALYKNNEEVGYAEGENLSDVKREARLQVPSFYPANMLILKVLKSNGY